MFGVRCLPGVRLTLIAREGAMILVSLTKAAQVFGREMVITCGNEGHPDLDPHSDGKALDVRSQGLPDAVVLQLYNWLKKDLGPDFTVLYECPATPIGVLASIATLNPKATAPHFHLQRRIGAPALTLAV